MLPLSANKKAGRSLAFIIDSHRKTLIPPMTTLELSREIGAAHNYIVRLFTDALSRYKEADDRPIDITRGVHTYSD